MVSRLGTNHAFLHTVTAKLQARIVSCGNSLVSLLTLAVRMEKHRDFRALHSLALIPHRLFGRWLAGCSRLILREAVERRPWILCIPVTMLPGPLLRAPPKPGDSLEQARLPWRILRIWRVSTRVVVRGRASLVPLSLGAILPLPDSGEVLYGGHAPAWPLHLDRRSGCEWFWQALAV